MNQLQIRNVICNFQILYDVITDIVMTWIEAMAHQLSYMYLYWASKHISSLLGIIDDSAFKSSHWITSINIFKAWIV